MQSPDEIYLNDIWANFWCFHWSDVLLKEIVKLKKNKYDQKIRYEKKKKTSKKSHRNIKSQNLRKRYIFFFVLRNVWFFTKFFNLKSISKKCDVCNWQCRTNQWVFPQAVPFKVNLKQKYSIDVCVAAYHVRQINETTQNTRKEIRYLLILWV